MYAFASCRRLRWQPDIIKVMKYPLRRGVAADDVVRTSSVELLNFLQNSSTGGAEAHPLWDSDTNVLAVPSIDDSR